MLLQRPGRHISGIDRAISKLKRKIKRPEEDQNIQAKAGIFSKRDSIHHEAVLARAPHADLTRTLPYRTHAFRDSRARRLSRLSAVSRSQIAWYSRVSSSDSAPAFRFASNVSKRSYNALLAFSTSVESSTATDTAPSGTYCTQTCEFWAVTCSAGEGGWDMASSDDTN